MLWYGRASVSDIYGTGIDLIRMRNGPQSQPLYRLQAGKQKEPESESDQAYLTPQSVLLSAQSCPSAVLEPAGQGSLCPVRGVGGC